VSSIHHISMAQLERRWIESETSTLEGIPFTSEYFKYVENDDNGDEIDWNDMCQCNQYGCYCGTKNQDCHCWYDGTECSESCLACRQLTREGLKDNRQISRRRSPYAKKHMVVEISKGIGKSFVVDEHYEDGDSIVAFIGRMVGGEKVDPSHNRYVIKIGPGTFRLLQDHGKWTKGHEFSDKEWCLDCTEIGCDANFINHSCCANNVDGVVVKIRGLPVPVIIANRHGIRGMCQYVNSTLYFLHEIYVSMI